MPIAVFGSKVFAVADSKIYTMINLQYGSSLDTEKQDALGKKPSTYNKGPGLNTLGFSLRLDISLGVNPRRELEEWEAIKDSGTAYPFVLGKKPLGVNKWLLVDVQGTNFTIDGLGNVLAMDLEFKFNEYVRPGSAEASKQNSISNTAKVSVPGLQPVDYKPVLGPEDKTAYKRTNDEMREKRLEAVERRLSGG
ncbi:phage tail protein [Desulfitobacterium hafniense]|uniref:phage tail protein n=1 Tax=Desulfitobacterium hafniense TaxID=49338 RepID=UPI00059E6A25|nr:phage tail protein [Desulfitobacterium hafniense]